MKSSGLPTLLGPTTKLPKKLSRLLINSRCYCSGTLHAKKYDETADRWQARVTRDWRFYFSIEGDTYTLQDIIRHPK